MKFHRKLLVLLCVAWGGLAYCPPPSIAVPIPPEVARAYALCERLNCNLTGCDERAAYWIKYLKEYGFEPCQATTITRSPNAAVICNQTGQVWNLHTAPAVTVDGKPWVIDPSFCSETGPVELRKWQQICGGEAFTHAPGCPSTVVDIEKLNEVHNWVNEHRDCPWKPTSLPPGEPDPMLPRHLADPRRPVAPPQLADPLHPTPRAPVAGGAGGSSGGGVPPQNLDPLHPPPAKAPSLNVEPPPWRAAEAAEEVVEVVQINGKWTKVVKVGGAIVKVLGVVGTVVEIATDPKDDPIYCMLHDEEAEGKFVCAVVSPFEWLFDVSCASFMDITRQPRGPAHPTRMKNLTIDGVPKKRRW